MLSGADSIVRYRPSRVLRGLVSPFAGFRLDPASASQHFGVPRPSVTVSMAFGDHALDVEAEGSAGASFWMLVGGLRMTPVRIGQRNGFHGLQFRTNPLAARKVLGVPAAALAGAVADFDDLVMVQHERLAELDWPQRFAILEDSLIRTAAGHHADVDTYPELAQAWSMIMTSHGRVRIATCANQVGWSRRRLSGRFSSEFGISPKDLARLARLRRCQSLAAQGLPLAEAAVRCGYADQPHMTRDWSSLTGQAPRSWLRDQDRHSHQIS